MLRPSNHTVNGVQHLVVNSARPRLTRTLALTLMWLAAFGICLLTLSQSAFAQDNPSAHTSGQRYDGRGRVIGTIAPDPDGAGNLTFLATRTTYDSGGKPILVETGDLLAWQSQAVVPRNWPNFRIHTSIATDYDGRGRKIRETVRGSDSVVSALTEYSYDALGRLLCTTQRMNLIASGNACIAGPQGSFGPDRITRNMYDAADQVLTIQRAVGTSIQQDYARYTYTPNGNQASVTDANGNRATLTHDGHDRLSQWNFPSLNAVGQTSTTDFETYTYDANGNRLSLRKRDSSIITFQYDALNRAIVKIIPERACVVGQSCLAATHTRDVFYAYDLRGLQTAARFDSLSGEGIVTAFDGFGRPISTTLTMDGVSRNISRAFDANGNSTRITHPDGIYFSMAYDGLNRMIGAAPNGAAQFVTISHDYRGRRSNIARGSSSTGYRYDPSSRLTELSQQFTSGNFGLTETLGYNPALQITSHNRTNSAYAYAGNVLGSQAYTVNGLNQYIGIGPASLAYDGNGNLTSDGSSTYVYDVENRLVGASGVNNATLRYDPSGRLYETGGGSAGLTRFLYDGDALIAEYASSGTLLRRYMHGPGADEPILWDEGGALNCATMRFLHSNHQGSIIASANCAGVPISTNTYDQWGVPGANYIDRFQYTGQAWIPELRMYHYKARVYSPTLGRFMQTDPIGYDDQINLYAYVGNDPINMLDSTGRSGESGQGGIGHNGGPPLDDIGDLARILRGLRTLSALGILEIAFRPVELNNGEAQSLAIDSLSRQVERRQNSLNSRHRDAALREARGEVVARRPDGRPYDHRNEIRETANGLRQDIIRVDQWLSRRNISSANRSVLTRTRARASSLLDVATRTLRRVELEMLRAGRN